MGAGGMRVLGERRRTSNGGGNRSWRGWLNRKQCRIGSCNSMGSSMISRDSTIVGWSSHSRRGNSTGRCSHEPRKSRRGGDRSKKASPGVIGKEIYGSIKGNHTRRVASSVGNILENKGFDVGLDCGVPVQTGEMEDRSDRTLEEKRSRVHGGGRQVNRSGVHGDALRCSRRKIISL
jgi:hypothetical protein